MAIGFEAFRAWRRRGRPEPESPRTIPRWDRPVPQVPAQYLSLYRYLEHRYASMVVLSFEQIETLMGCSLPPSARTEPEWWTADAAPTAHASAWTDAGRTALPNFMARTVAFERV